MLQRQARLKSEIYDVNETGVAINETGVAIKTEAGRQEFFRRPLPWC
jgi:hypothetical protein